ncbi:Gfo/Idh/MocA family protein [Marinicrinis lubricantis]|uniref:Gfo/Idh/MocA family protein n=1 Tax=Marinicrinis lubricantis TaxID=2086470 RepID=A0ABW1INH0_9BACL
MSDKKLRWGILSTAGIARRSVIPGIQQSQTGEVYAVASRDASKAMAFAEELGIPKSYGSYEELLADADVDAVYIPLPNHLHKEWTIKAAEAGKHVLCEKPAALDAQEAEEMTAACHKAGVIYAEAFMYRHHPRYEQIREHIHSGEIGELRGIHGTFTFNSAGSKENIRFHQDMGGGSLYDVGCYPISAARMLIGTEPIAATCHAFFSPDHGGVDMMLAGLVEFENGVSLSFDCGMWAAYRNTLEILGTKGRIEIPCAFTTHSSPNYFIETADGRKEIEVPVVNHYACQADDFGRAVLEGASYPFDPMDSILNMRVIDACLKSARERVRVTC